MAEEKKTPSLFDSLKRAFSSEKEPTPPAEEIPMEETVPQEDEKATLTRTVDYSDTASQETTSLQGASQSEEIDIRFAENFAAEGGKFVYCEHLTRMFQLLESLKKENKWNFVYAWTPSILKMMEEQDFQQHTIGFFLDNSDAAISVCEYCCADEGVIVLAPEQASNRKLVSFPDVHIIIATKDNLISNLDEAITKFSAQHNGRLPALIEMQSDKRVSKHYHSSTISGGETKDTFIFYVDSLSA